MPSSSTPAASPDVTDDEVQMQLSGLLRMGQQARLRALFQNDSISKHIKAQAERAQV